MGDENQSERIEWRNGATPVSSLFGDPYFSLAGGLAETRHVFVAGNGLPGRFADGFGIAELGFGTGLNLLATAAAWAGAGVAGTLRYTGFDAFGRPIDRSVAGFHARVVQHECDHLDGILYPMRIKDFSRFGFVDELFPNGGAAVAE